MALFRLTRANLLCLAGYLACMAALVFGLWTARRNIVQQLGTPQATEQWQEWKSQAAQDAQRKQPKSDVPPLLILMRDHFPVIFTGSLVIGTVFYGALVFFVRGAFQQRAFRQRANGEPVAR